MKMTQLLWRIVSVSLCVAVVCWYSGRHVGCLELHPEVHKPEFSQDVPSEEEPEKATPLEKNEQSSALPAQSSSKNEKVEEDRHSNLEQLTQEEEQKQNAEGFDAENAAPEAELEADKGSSQPEQSSEYCHSDSSVSQHQNCAAPPPFTDSGLPAPNHDDPSIPSSQKDIPKSDSNDADDVAAPEATDFDCAEEANNPYDKNSPPPFLENTFNAHTAGTKTLTDPPLSSPAVHSTKHLEANTSHKQDAGSPVTSDTDPPASSKDPEDIPTFDEWKRKMMEVEKEKTLSTHPSSNGGSHTVKKVQKNFNNYASVECGAKLLGANPEAKSTSAILKENMDMYMLNPCSTKIWFIIELCEPIQVKQLDIANFELFSSTPKDFLVSISDRYPTNKWLKLGTFHARDERTVQSFPLDEQLYAKYVKMFTKYIKVELLSHFGSEHFCPLSLIRVFGTSMMAEYEEFADPSERPDDQDDDPDYPPGVSPGESNNLIGSATDAILNMVNNIAVNVLGGNSGNLSSQEGNFTEPSQQPETTTKIVTTNLTAVLDTEDVQVSSPTETAESETQTTDKCEQELPPEEEKLVIPLEKDEEQPIGSTITLLDKEEVDEDRHAKDHHERHQDDLKCCPPFSSSLCSCAASFQEFVQQQCSASLSKKRSCQTIDRTLNIIPTILTPTWPLPALPSSCPQPQLQPHDAEVNQPHEKEQASEQEPESEAVISETGQPSGNAEGSVSELTVLEPSQSLNLPKPSLTESSFIEPTPVVETPKLSSEEPAKTLEPEKSQGAPPEEKHVELSASLSSSAHVKPTISVSADEPTAAPTEEKPDVDAPEKETNVPIQTQEKMPQAPVLSSTSSSSVEDQAEPAVVSEIIPASTEVSPSVADAVTEPQPSGSLTPVTDTITEEHAEDFSTSSAGSGQLFHPSPPTASSPTSPSLSDIYAEPFNGTEQNGNLMHSSNQKESVFMRLNNRIKALEVNMSLSGRYLEQLSQRYRKQMEEMQRAFNKTIIKLQNTSRLAEEQDLRQTESIQLLQGQLENVTHLVLNLSVRVSQLQNEVSDRQNYLLLSLGLCLCLGLFLCFNHCRITFPSSSEPEPPSPKSYTYCGPERQLSSCDEMGLKRSASYPLIYSESVQLATTEGPEMLHAEETQSLSPANRKRRRRKIKPTDKVETLKPSFQASPELCNGAVGCHAVPVPTNATFLTKQLLQPAFRDSPSEGSSEGSSHSDDPSFCGITAACSRICDDLPPPKTRAEKRASRRRRPKPGCAVVDLLHAPQRDKNEHLPITLQDIINRKTEQNSGAFVALTGPA
ncbi:SUN domain-containing ossification factor isoform X2 [Kryptolebias marmoratus]|uniref:SUN domain-containing ossification factor n=1 Tax=Kryptolebias marmoratus TaxID=37003 RepID=A0A3Q3F5F3_KRYMA|nr:SUN domain-containing ossification factor isoform X2 [Kryptolebias marmoratus]